MALSPQTNNPIVSIGHLSIAPRQHTEPDPWFCIFPYELQRLPLTKSQVALWGELTRAATGLSEKGRILIRTTEIRCFTYQYRQNLLNQLAQLGVLRKESIGIWAINPRYAWAGPLRARQKAIEQFEAGELSEEKEEI